MGSTFLMMPSKKRPARLRDGGAAAPGRSPAVTTQQTASTTGSRLVHPPRVVRAGGTGVHGAGVVESWLGISGCGRGWGAVVCSGYRPACHVNHGDRWRGPQGRARLPPRANRPGFTQTAPGRVIEEGTPVPLSERPWMGCGQPSRSGPASAWQSCGQKTLRNSSAIDHSAEEPSGSAAHSRHLLTSSPRSRPLTFLSAPTARY